MRPLYRDLLYLAIAGLLVWWLWPERYTVNAPTGRDKSAPAAELLHERLRLPVGFSIALYASDLPGARMLRFTEAGDLLVSLPYSGQIVLLERDGDGDRQPDGRHDLLSGLNRPHGMDLHDGWLYVAETNAIGRIRFNAATGSIAGELERIVTDLPGGGLHWTRSLRFSPDGWLYIAVGSSCNACKERNLRRAALLRFRPDGSGGELYATGLRNTVGFDWRPGINELYGADNGRDFLGDDFPPCELNRIERGQFYGWPYANGDKFPDPEYGKGHEDKIRESVAPVHKFGAHTAPLGITFLRGQNLPVEYRGAALVALHGSWNRTRKQGYEVILLHFGADGKIAERKFITGFELNEDVIGRPVDVAEGPDGALYISDDFTGSVYRVVINK
jgi:Glucose/sorbosone dehydrogenases